VLRFRREARAAARLHHTNIVPVFDVGERGGIHYYAMQFIPGQGLDQVIRELRRLRRPGGGDETDERAGAGAAADLAASLAEDVLSGEFRGRPGAVEAGVATPPPASPGEATAGSASSLLSRSDPSSHSDAYFYRSVARIGRQVASALAYAHGQRVLHRDVKPSNLLLAADGTVWVTDFGLAKEEGQDLTRTGDVVGTLRYIAPERFTRPADARGDVYSLGLTLYELLTLRPAFAEADRVRLVHAIAHREPEPPRKLDPQVPRDLETVVLKAISKDPGRRYQRAEELEADLSRFLLDRPIAARRASAWERTWRWCRRNPLAAGLALTLALLLAGGVAGLTALYLKADAQRRRAEAAEAASRVAAEEARLGEGKARESEARARQSAAEAKAVLDFFVQRVMAAPRPSALEGGVGRDVTLREALDRAEPEVGRTFAGQPLVEAEIRSALGNTYSYLARNDRALAQHERALALRQAHLPADDPDVLGSLGSVAFEYQLLGRFGEALKLHEETLRLRKVRLGPDHPKTILSTCRLAQTLSWLGRAPEAMPLYEEVFRRAQTALGPENIETVYYMSVLGEAYRPAGRTAEALPLLEKALALQTAQRGPDYLDTLNTINQVGTAYYDLGRTAEALATWEEALRRTKQALGADSTRALALMNNLATAYEANGRMTEAIRLYEESRRIHTAKLGPDAFNTLVCTVNLAGAYRDAGRPAEALPLFEEALARSGAKLVADHPVRLIFMNYTADCRLRMKKLDEAAALLRECLTLRLRRDPDDWWVYQTKSQLGQVLAARGKYGDAELLLVEAHQGLERRKGKMAVRHQRYIGEAARALVSLYEASGKPGQAAEWRRKLPPEPSAR
jgi:tetratricopeptide (TPR) repeat protein